MPKYSKEEYEALDRAMNNYAEVITIPSRNKREGKYAGCIRNTHRRTQYPFMFTPRSYVAATVYYIRSKQ